MIALLILLLLFVILFLLSFFYRRRYAIPLRYYLAMFALPIVIAMMPCISNISFSSAVSKFRCDFFVIAVCVTAFFIVKSITLNLKLPRHFNVNWCSLFKVYLRRLCGTILEIISVSVLILLIYIQLFNSLGKTGHIDTANSSADLAVCAAIIAACATLYNVQRTLKQESTKNRQAWITSVRFETANLIAAVDKTKLYERHNMNGHFDAERRERLLDSMIESCTKLRMLINPNDAVAPMLAAQLDAIANYYNENFNDEANHIDHIENVNLRESFMPWVLVLLKVEWERVKAILESREEIIEGYYSRDVYGEWNELDFLNYGVDDDGMILINARLQNIPAEDGAERDRILGHAFPGFHFNNATKLKLLPIRNRL